MAHAPELRMRRRASSHCHGRARAGHPAFSARRAEVAGTSPVTTTGNVPFNCPRRHAGAVLCFSGALHAHSSCASSRRSSARRSRATTATTRSASRRSSPGTTSTTARSMGSCAPGTCRCAGPRSPPAPTIRSQARVAKRRRRACVLGPRIRIRCAGRSSRPPGATSSRNGATSWRPGTCCSSA